MTHVERDCDLDTELRALQRAVFWSGSALAVGMIVGINLGLGLGRRIERHQNERESKDRSEEATP